ncbi:MAG: UTP--glucose-1-phosphate uridylyltransferase [Lachnospiraceae bacterium]|nr:UTP--glucose-1-phosphate uridylyltransferase [Lachnospiraceae bacterium]
MNYNEAIKKLEKYGQTHLLKYYEELAPDKQIKLLTQIEETDFSPIEALNDLKAPSLRGQITPLKAMEIYEIKARRDEFVELGTKAIKDGKVGAVILAGGMGTRLGSDKPKGLYDIGLTKPVYIFQRLIENLLEVVKLTKTNIPLYIMTSDKNNDQTINFLKQFNYFGYDKNYVTFFKQEMAPASDYNGKVFLEEKDQIAASPNGNGGWYASMDKNGVAGRAKEQGIEWLNIFNVDNVLQRITDPCFIGATISANCAVGAKVVRKNARDEKVGAICLEDGRPSIVEYYDMTDELMDARDENGNPAYGFGVIMNYLFRVKNLDEILEKKLEIHVVEKKIPHLDEDGKKVNPAEPNGYKYEMLALDMIHQLENCLPYEVEREYEFAPIKNQTGVDSVESARNLCLKNGILL